MKEQIPNGNLILILGILSILLTCCSPVFGLPMAIIALILAKKAQNTYNEDKTKYKGYSNVKTGKITAWIGIAFSVVIVVIFIREVMEYGWDGYVQRMMQQLDQLKNLQGGGDL